MVRIVALLVVLLLTVSTTGADWLLCGGSARSAAASHACCDDMQMRVSAQDASGCCALSEQARERAPVEARLAPASVATLTAGRAPFAAVVVATPQLADASATFLAHAVPIYLQHRSLLI